MRQDRAGYYLFRRPHRRHLPLEGRERLDHRSRRDHRRLSGGGRSGRLRRGGARRRRPRRAWRRSSPARASTSPRLHAHLAERLPDYARPLFLRIREAIDDHRHLQAAKAGAAARGLRSRRDRRCDLPQRPERRCVRAGSMRHCSAAIQQRRVAALSRAAGVDGQHGAGDVARLVAEQEFDRIGDIVDLGEAVRAGCAARPARAGRRPCPRSSPCRQSRARPH